MKRPANPVPRFEARLGSDGLFLLRRNLRSQVISGVAVVIQLADRGLSVLLSSTAGASCSIEHGGYPCGSRLSEPGSSGI